MLLVLLATKQATKLFLKCGANPYLRTNFDDDALQICCLKAFTEIFEYLISNVEYSNERISEAHELIGCSLFDEYFDLARVTYHWKTALEIRNRDLANPIKKIRCQTGAIMDPYRYKAYRGCEEFVTLLNLMSYEYNVCLYENVYCAHFTKRQFKG